MPRRLRNLPQDKMVTKTQLAFLLVTCVVMALLFEPAVSQKDALRWGKRDSGVHEEYAPINPNHRRRQYDNDEDYYREDERRSDLPGHFRL